MKIKDITKDGLFSDGDWIESKDQDPKGEVRLIQLADIGDGCFINKSNRFMNIETAKRLKCTFLKKDDILIARMPDPVGRCCLFPLEGEHKYVTVVDICILRIGKSVNRKYLKYGLNNPIVRNRINEQITGTTRKRITKKKLGELEIPLPPLAEQKRIANILDHADQLRQLNQQILAEYDVLTKSLFLDMFGDPVVNPMGWEKKSVINYCSCIVPGRDKPKSFTGKTPWITTADLKHLEFTFYSKKSIGLTTNEIAEVRAKIIPKESVIMTCVGDLGIVTINKENIVVNQQLHAFQCSEQINNVFLMYNLSYQTPYMHKMASSTTVPYMNKTVANNTPTILPPIALQNQFAQKIKNIEAQKAKAQAALAASEDLFNHLLQKAFKGEL